MSSINKLTRQSVHGRIEAVTLTASDLGAAAAAYLQALGQRRVSTGSLDGELVASWAAPAMVGRSFELLEPPSDAPFWLRLLEAGRGARGESVSSTRRTYGWAALELTVRDADALHGRLSQDPRFRIIGAPAPLPGLMEIYPMQAEGPMGEVLYLNEIRGDLEDHDLPRAGCEVDHVFIAVLGAPDLEAAVAFYVDVLGFDAADSYEIPYRVINDAFELPAETKHRLTTTCVGRRLNVEVDQYPDGAMDRQAAAGELPPAMAMVSFAVEDLEPFRERALGPILERQEAPYLGRRALTLRGAAGELVELIEGEPRIDLLQAD